MSALLKPVENCEAQREFVTFSVMDQLFGIPVLQVREVLHAPSIAPIPLAPPEIAGSINLRGRIVTAVDVRRRLNLPPAKDAGMSIVVDHHGELYSLIIDRAGDVISLKAEDCEDNPATLDPQWQEVASGIYSLENTLLVVLDTSRLLRLARPTEIN
ncbi:MAG TPA: chemotaxis protein CheW [Alphaproteobacteria bacterium]|nr:chemotaxis protein CheW [Alphaproteobacteria bacterium]